MVVTKCQKNAEKFICEECNFTCSKQSNYDKHLLTRKHQMVENGSKMVGEKMPTTYTCICGNVYKHDSGYYRHKKMCKKMPEIFCDEEVSKNNETPPDIVVQLLKDNQEFKIMLIEQQEHIKKTQEENQKLQGQLIEALKDSGNTTNNNYNNTNNNQQFNLNFFLNNTCKDAMNITDFINSLKLTLQDLEKVGELGYAEGISNMFVKGLNDLEINKRPIHCSDLKREIIHIKDKDKWEKDNSNQDKLKRAIKDLSNKNIMLFDDWQKENPGYDQYDNKKNDIYLKMMVQAMGPPDEPSERRDFGKIVRSIARNTIIDKSPDLK